MTKALTNLFSGSVKKVETGRNRYMIQVEGDTTSSLENFRFILHRDRIRAAARAVLSRGVDANRILVFLNKQVAHVGHVSFCEPVGESPLGPIRLQVDCDDPQQVIDWLTGGYEERKREKN